MGQDASTRLLDLGEEEWSEPYNGGRELFACGGGSKKISKADRTALSDLEGEWRAVEGRSASFDASGAPAASEPSSSVSALPSEGLEGLSGLVLLPSGAYSYVALGGDLVRVHVEAGWLVDGGKQRRVSRAVYEGDRLMSVHMGVEQRV